MLVTYGSYAFKRKEYNLCVLTDKTLNLTDPLKTTTTTKKKKKKKKKTLLAIFFSSLTGLRLT